MRNSIFVLSLFLISVLTGYAQVNQNEQRFQKVDQHVSKVAKQLIFHPQLLSQKLSEGLTNDYDKVRAFYVWIARNIDYDLLGYIHNIKGGQSITEVLRSGKALCTGFSLLFKYFCEEAHIESVIIEGYAKGYGYRKKQKFEKPNHAWNAVKIYDQWYLLDVTWATGNPENLSKHQKKIDLYTFFLADPAIFIKSHLPEDPTWQLLKQKISLQDFELDEYQHDTDWPYNSYTPVDYNGMNENDANLLKLKRAKEFNPENAMTDALLAFAYLYKGISMTDEIWKMNYFQLLDTAQYLATTFYAYMDSANLISKTINYRKVPYKREIIPDEINYQKGVINYELGVELFSKAMSINIPFRQAETGTNKYFEIAEKHFKLTPSTSIYSNDAKEYLSYIDAFRNKKVNWTELD